MAELVVRHPDSSTETIPETVEWSRTRELGKMRRAQITVERSLAEAVSLTKKRDIIELGDIDTLVLVDIGGGGSTRELICYSFEWLANRYAFLPGGAEREGDDNTLITNLISGVSEWSAGSIGDFTGPMSFVFNHAHRHDALRRIERNTPGEIRFYNEGTIDYVDALGTDKSGSVELSGAAGTIEDSITITERGREYDGTHVRLIGAHEGEAQYSANLVPDADPYDYENDPDFSGVVRYTTPRWTEEADTDWDIWKNKDVADQQTIEEEAATLGKELTDTLVEAKTTVVGPDLDVGDFVQVVKPSADLDRTMRVHRIKEVVKGATKKLKVLLSTRTTMRQSDDEELEGIRQFNTSFQGSSVAVNGGPIRGAVDGSNNLEFGFRYPDLEYENTAEIQVKTLPYRIDSQGAASGGGAFVTSESGGGAVVTSTGAGSDDTSTLAAASNTDTQTQTVGPVNIPDNADNVNNDLYARLDIDASGVGTIDTIEVVDNSTLGTVVSHQDIGVSQLTAFFPIDSVTNRLGNPIEATVTLTSSPSGFWDSSLVAVAENEHAHDVDIPAHVHDVDVPQHTHEPQPGIYTTADTPTNVDVLINGSTVASDIGTGTFETTVDIGGELTNDAWNDIAISSDSLGLAQASVFVEGYDQIGKN